MSKNTYPSPHPDQKNANWQHGTGMDKAAPENLHGTMGTKPGVYGGMGGKSHKSK